LNRKRAAGGCQDKVFLFGDEREREREREKVDPWVWIYKSFRDVNGYGVVCVKTLRISGNACPICDCRLCHDDSVRRVRRRRRSDC
jgi:hypothetical protein